MNNKINYKSGLSAIEDTAFLEKCVELYSNHYGIWSDKGINPHSNIKLSKDRLTNWLTKEKTYIYYTYCDEKLIGYAIVCRKNIKNFGVVSWVTQLVVHTEYRNRGIAKNLLYSIWCMSNDKAWGIVSSNPYAIRALEKATRRRTDPVRIKKNYRKLLNISAEFTPYINSKTEIKINKETSQINTNFYVDHSNNESKIKNIVSQDVKWTLGNLKDGWEWFAFTFNDQEQIELTTEEIANMISASEEITQKAYERMQLNDSNHKWMTYTKAETNYIIKKCDVTKDDLVFDFGCGIGRHSVQLSNYCKNIIGIDYIDNNIETAKFNAERSNRKNVAFVKGDCRSFKYKNQADAIICLYDVIGTFKKSIDNENIIKQISYNLKLGGKALISVMNYESTEYNAIHKFEFDKNPNEILKLLSSNTMEKTGNIFDPKFYLVDTKTKIIYRKEQFSPKNDIPVEYIVMDKRFSMDEIVTLCEKNHLEVIEKKYVNASNWEKDLTPTDKKAKEILLLCRKTLN